MAKRPLLLGLLLLALVLGLDQFTKEQALWLLLPVQPSIIEVTSFFNLALVWNQGISFGMFATPQPHLITGISIAIVTILLIWLIKNKSMLTGIALGLVIGGAVGNIIDRFRYGAVVDFLDFHIGNFHWPAFNIADSAIFIGVVLLCVGSMFTGHHNTRGNAA